MIKTPPVPWTNHHIKLALSKNIPVEVDASLFFQLCKNPIIGITGTKGKTTTASLIFQILKLAGKNPVKVGVGQVAVLDKLDELKKDSLVVFELSSWRLASLGRAKISPQIAVWTNLFPDHLNYYKSMETYKKDKQQIINYQKPEDAAIINWDQEVLRSLEGEIKSKLIKFSALTNFGENSVYVKDEAIFWQEGEEARKILDISEIKLKGKHNIGNVLAACGAAIAAGVSLEKIRKAVAEFSGIPHRLEMVRKMNGVTYYNDTSATNPESAIAGINSFTEPIVLIAGGSDKNLKVDELARVIAEKIKETILIKGNATTKVLDEFKKMGIRKNFPVVDSMEKAVSLAREIAKDGDVVLLSPGAASFGVFKNEFDRGNQFKEIVGKLK